MVRLQELRRRARSLLVSSGAAPPRIFRRFDSGSGARSVFARGRSFYGKSATKCRRLSLRAAESMTARRASRRARSPMFFTKPKFYGYSFKVGRGVLIPRPETELLVEEALRLFPRGTAARFADWCTGSGCIAAALLLENPRAIGARRRQKPQRAQMGRDQQKAPRSSRNASSSCATRSRRSRPSRTARLTSS